MAKKMKNIIIEKDPPLHRFMVWMDDGIVDAVRNIPGVIDVALHSLEDTYYFVYFDPRYDWEGLKSEMEELANSYAED